MDEPFEAQGHPQLPDRGVGAVHAGLDKVASGGEEGGKRGVAAGHCEVLDAEAGAVRQADEDLQGVGLALQGHQRAGQLPQGVRLRGEVGGDQQGQVRPQRQPAPLRQLRLPRPRHPRHAAQGAPHLVALHPAGLRAAGHPQLVRHGHYNNNSRPAAQALPAGPRNQQEQRTRSHHCPRGGPADAAISCRRPCDSGGAGISHVVGRAVVVDADAGLRGSGSAVAAFLRDLQQYHNHPHHLQVQELREPHWIHQQDAGHPPLLRISPTMQSIFIYALTFLNPDNNWL